MLKLIIKEGNLDKTLKKFKKDLEKTKVLRELRERQHYIKPSVQKRNQLKKAAYRNQYLTENELI